MLLPRLLLLLPVLLLMPSYTTLEEIYDYIIFSRSLSVSGSTFSVQVNLDRVLIDNPSCFPEVDPEQGRIEEIIYRDDGTTDRFKRDHYWLKKSTAGAPQRLGSRSVCILPLVVIQRSST